MPKKKEENDVVEVSPTGDLGGPESPIKPPDSSVEATHPIVLPAEEELPGEPVQIDAREIIKIVFDDRAHDRQKLLSLEAYLRGEAGAAVRAKLGEPEPEAPPEREPKA